MQEMTIVFISALIMIFLARPAAIKVGLVDKPGQRKTHQGNIPLVGGLSIYFSLWMLFAIRPEWLHDFAIYMACATLLLLIGILDDRFDLPVLPRIFLQALVASGMMLSGHYLMTLGNILFGHELLLGWSGFAVTLLAVWGAINAFNMIDGIDGVLGAHTVITFGALAVMFYLGGSPQHAQWSLCLLAAALPYMALNLGIVGGGKLKVFMGDAGSTLIGFTAIWLLIQATQGDDAVMRPVTALWFIALPLMDMVAVMGRRIYRGVSPFKPDREHVHHILHRAGLSLPQTLAAIAGAALCFAALGIGAECSGLAEFTVLSLFVLASAGYFAAISRARVWVTWLYHIKGLPSGVPQADRQSPFNK